MGYSRDETLHLERADADATQEAKGIQGYSEVYGLGVFPCKVIHPETKEIVDGWRAVTETYYG